MSSRRGPAKSILDHLVKQQARTNPRNNAQGVDVPAMARGCGAAPSETSPRVRPRQMWHLHGATRGLNLHYRKLHAASAADPSAFLSGAASAVLPGSSSAVSARASASPTWGGQASVFASSPLRVMLTGLKFKVRPCALHICRPSCRELVPGPIAEGEKVFRSRSRSPLSCLQVLALPLLLLPLLLS